MVLGTDGRSQGREQAKDPVVASKNVELALVWTAVVVGAGLGGVLGMALLDQCCGDLGGVVFFPIVAAWSIAMGVAAGRWASRRTLGAAVALLMLLAWIVAHFLVPDFLDVYEPLDAILDAGGGPLGVLLFWAFAGTFMVVALLGVERVVQRIR